MTHSPSSGTATSVDLACMRLSYTAMFPSAIAATVAAFAVAWILARQLPTGPIIVWALIAFVLGALRVGLSASFRRHERSDEATRAFLPIYATVMALAAANWGALIAFTGMSTSPFVIGIIVLVIGGMMSMGAQSLAMTPRVFRASVLLSLSPIGVHMLLSGDPVLRAFFVILVMHVFSMLASVRTNNVATRDAIALRFENQDLIRALEQERARESHARADAEHANREKTRFLAAASHDVRQPLHALGLFVDALRAQALPPVAARLVASIERAHGSLASLHEGLLDVSRFDAGVVVSIPSPVRARDILERLETEARPSALERGLELRIVAADVTLETDGELLLRVLRNLVANSLAYTPKGRVLVCVRRRGARALVQVWDTGIGIPEAEQAHIFDELYQVGNRARDREQGLGLGLAIVRRLATLLGTQVEVRSRPGKGSVFQLFVPIASEPAAERALDQSAPADLRVLSGTTALVVDDDALARVALATTLERWGYEVVSARNAAEAREYGRELPRLDLLVTDLWLSDGSGIDVARALARPDLARVVTTGDTDPEVADTVRAEGIAFVLKPVRASTLWNATRPRG